MLLGLVGTMRCCAALTWQLWFVVYARRHYHGPNEMIDFPTNEEHASDANLNEAMPVKA